MSIYKNDYDLADVIATLPVWITTSVFEERAALRVKSADKVALKARYRDIFAAEWKARAPELHRRFGIASWQAFATQGTEEKPVGDDFAASGSGGLRIVLLTDDGNPKAFLWMRGSGTEPVFRIMADIEGGSPEDEAYLLSWHGGMVRAADL
jgi:phosphoglucomutase